MGLGISIAVDGTADAELSAAVWVEVHQRMGEMTKYRVRYDIDIDKGDFPNLIDSRIDAGSELSVIAPVSGANNYLVKGPVTGQRIFYQHAGGAATWKWKAPTPRSKWGASRKP
jgi:hypothetical protein